MSTLPPIADIRATKEMSAMGQKRTHALEQKGSLFDHLVRASHEHRRKLQPQGLGRANVHNELELRRLLNRKIARLDTLEDLFDLACGTTVEIMKTRSECYQTARIHHFP